MKNLYCSIIAFSSAVIILSSCGDSDSKSSSTAPAEIKAEGASPGTPGDPVKGEEVYKKTCVACHQTNGEGILNTFPPLAKSDFLGNKEAVIHQVIKGKTGELVVNGVTYNNVMPPQNLTDEEIASVLTFVYSSWGNNAAVFTNEEVKAIRDKAN